MNKAAKKIVAPQAVDALDNVGAVAPDAGTSAPPAVEHRSKPPAFPFLVGANAQRAAQQIAGIGNLATRSKPDSFEAAIRAIRLVSTKNLHPNVGIYRAEVIDWLEGQKQPS